MKFHLLLFVSVISSFSLLGQQEKTFRFEPLPAPASHNAYTAEIDGIHWGDAEFADIDNDGDQDLILVGGTGSSKSIGRFYLNDGNGNFIRSRRNLPEGHIRCDLELADIDNDNDLDLLISGQATKHNTRVYRNNGKGDFNALPYTFFTHLTYSSVAFADVDNDNDQDFVITGDGISGLMISELYINNGNGDFTKDTNNYFEPIQEGDIKFIDIDGDNDMDFVQFGKTATNNRVTQVYFNDSLGVFRLDTVNQYPNFNHGSIAFGDLDGDTDIDMIMSGNSNVFGGRRTEIFLNNGSGVFTIKATNNLTPMEESALQLGDFDGDGDLDLVISGRDGSGFGNYGSALFLNDGSSNFSLVSGIPFIEVLYSAIDTADIDNDGDLDLLICGSDKNYKNLTQIYVNNGNASFQAISTSSFPGYEHSNHSFGDADQDGDPDVMILGDDGRFPTTRFFEMDSTGKYQLINNTFNGIRSGEIILEDFDNDQDLDLVYSGNRTNYAGGTYYYKNDGNNNFTSQSTNFNPDLYGHIASGDIDHDNDLDIVITGNGFYSKAFSTGLYQNDTGNFNIEINTPFDTSDFILTALDDLNNDGFADVIVFGSDTNYKPLNQVYLNQNGMFILVPNNLFPRISVTSYSLEDINNDSLKDLFIAGADSVARPFAYLYINQGNGLFQQDTTNQFNGFRNGSIAFADFDGDADLDLITIGSVGIGANYPSTSIYRNDSGFFQPVQNIDLEITQNGEISIADVDNDGLPDVLLSGTNEFNENFIRLYRNVSCFDSYSTDTIVTCDSITWIDGITYSSSTSTPTYRLTNAEGCDSIVSLILTVIQDTISVDSVSNCGPYTWLSNNTTYYQSGSYFDTLQNSFGCDSILRLDLQIDHVPYDSVVLVICDTAYTWPRTGQTFYESGRYYDTTANAVGCDSINGLILTLDTLNLQVTVNRDTLTALGTFFSYQWLDCANQFQVIPNADSSVFISGRNGSFAFEANDGLCLDTSQCYSVILTALESQLPSESIRLFPNPFKNEINIEWENQQPDWIKVYTLDGKLLYEQFEFNANRETINITISPGVYVFSYSVNGITNFKKIINN